MKKHIILILRTLFSNNACVEAARTKEKKYNIIAIIFVLFSLFFAALPTCVTGFQQNGGNWIRGTINYGFDNAMREFGEFTALPDRNVSFKLSEDHKLTASNWEKMNQYPGQETEEENKKLYTFIATAPNPEDGGEHKIMEIFYCDESVCDFNLFVEEIVKNINPLKIKDYKDDQDKKAREEEPANMLETEIKEDKTVVKTRSTSFIVFGTSHIQGVICAPGITSVASSVYGDYGNTPACDDLIHSVLAKKDATTDEILEANRTFYDQVYVNPRRANTWRSTGIILGVDAGVILLMGFMVWVLTRGKNNPFRIYTFWDGQKIAYYACLTPGIISLFGFLMSNMAMMLFILAIGMRVMWLSMRTLRYQAPAK